MNGMDRLTDLGWAMEAIKTEANWSADDFSCGYEPSDGHHAVATILNAIISGELERRASQTATAPYDQFVTTLPQEAFDAFAKACEGAPAPSDGLQEAVDAAWNDAIEAAALWAEDGFTCRACDTPFLASVGHYDEDCPKGRAAWDGLPKDQLPIRIRALRRVAPTEDR